MHQSAFWPLGTIFGASLAALINTRGIQTATHNVVAHTRKIFNTATPDQNHRVFLQIVAFASYVCGHLKTVR